jgi:hypothetical protein
MLSQTKLTKSEWDQMEIPIPQDEQYILNFIKNGYHNVQLKRNQHNSLIGILKSDNASEIHDYLYLKYFAEEINKIKVFNKVKDITITIKDAKNIKIKNIDKIRISNNDANLNKATIYDYIMLKLCDLMVRHNEKMDISDDVKYCNAYWMYYYYTLKRMLTYSISNINTHVVYFINEALNVLESEINIEHFILYADYFVERNQLTIKYSDINLYEHQKQIFTIVKNKNPKLILYIAPTGTGKTLTPIGLSETHKVIFVCAARHVGLALAKSSISTHKKIAFAFGCRSADDIRLHFFAAKEIVRDKRSGGIRKVDNSVGDNVEIMICDIQSYLHAMYYMKAFNKVENIITFWDEPTITMDVETHTNPLHSVISELWKQNIIPNFILSSATLPHEHDIRDTILSFKTKFPSAEIHNIVSHDCCKSIPILNKAGHVEMPHTLFSDYNDIKTCVSHCEKNNTIMRYLGLSQIIEFIMHVDEEQLWTHERYSILHYFSSMEEITVTNIKKYYLIILNHVKPASWNSIFELFKMDNTNTLSTINFTTSDANTIVDGPAIFLTNDVEKVALFAIQSANIPPQVITDIMDSIAYNNKLSEQIEMLENEIEDKVNATMGSGSGSSDAAAKSDKVDKCWDRRLNSGSIHEMTQKIETIRSKLKPTLLNDLFVPNRITHLTHWHSEYDSDDKKKYWSSCIEEEYVNKIMLLPIESNWKMLLLMGIAAISEHKNAKYNEIIKELTASKKIFLIIASSDYIYGTHYQFSHGYISKDLENMTQEKTLQAMGRIGRSKIQQTYSVRFRDDSLIRSLFLPSTNKIEALNMNTLLS